MMHRRTAVGGEKAGRGTAGEVEMLATERPKREDILASLMPSSKKSHECACTCLTTNRPKSSNTIGVHGWAASL